MHQFAAALRYLSISALVVVCVFAPGSSPQSVVTLSGKADAVVVGSVSQAAYANGTVTLTVNVERSLKGNLSAGASHLVQWHDVSRYHPPLNAANARGMFFLTRDSGGHWIVRPAWGGYVSSTRQLFFMFPNSSVPTSFVDSLPVNDRIFAEILAAEENGGLDPTGGIVDLVGEYRRARTPATAAMLAAAANSSSAKLKAVSLRAGLMDGDIAALGRVEREHQA